MEGEKLQQLLKVQAEISADYKKSLEDKDKLVSELKEELERKMAGQTKLLDIKNERVRVLESRIEGLLGDTTKDKTLSKTSGEPTGVEDLDLTEGENVMEIELKQIKFRNPPKKSILVTFDFYKNETIVSPAYPSTDLLSKDFVAQ
jgi:hypothetical protein